MIKRYPLFLHFMATLCTRVGVMRGCRQINREPKRNERFHGAWGERRLCGEGSSESESDTWETRAWYLHVHFFLFLAFDKDRKSGRTALHLAAEEANLELIRLFLELPSCLSFVNAKVLLERFKNCTGIGMTFFILSSSFWAAFVKVSLPDRVISSLCLQAYNGNTALHVAASLQYRVTQLDAVRLLMRKGADPSTRNLENEQPVHLVPDGPVGEQVRAADVRRDTVRHWSGRKGPRPAGAFQVGSISAWISQWSL